MPSNPVYNVIGKTYDSTRKADPKMVEKITHLLQPRESGKYLDIACGSGNYTNALNQRGIEIEGIDISDEMLNKARKKYPFITFNQASATELPFSNDSFDGAICIFATHHIANNKKAFQEAYRVIKNGKFVIFTATPSQMENYWLCHYFPQMMEKGIAMMTEYLDIKNDLELAGFKNIQQSPFFITNELQDWFLHAGKYRPEIYLDETVRHGMSFFHISSYPQEMFQGLEHLKSDIATGKINEIIKRFESKEGDCMFIVGEK